jgi:hypothetical protein
MKKITGIIILAMIIISVCVLLLVKSGISLRADSLISPSAMSDGIQGVSAAVTSRLFPDFQKARYTLFGFLPFTEDSRKLFEQMQLDYEKSFHTTVNILEFNPHLTAEVFEACTKPCWVLMDHDKANQLKENPILEKFIRPLDDSFFTLTYMTFNSGVKASDACMSEKRLDFECLTPVLVQQNERKIKPHQRNFFLNSYKETDFFIFVQNP